MQRLTIIALTLITLFFLAACGASGGSRVACAGEREVAELDSARLYIEYNATDGDLGVHGGFDSSGWSELCVFAPDGTQILGVKPEAQLGELTVGGFFFESREPELTEFDFDRLAAEFPEGEYQVRALSFDGRMLTGAATFTHIAPAAPVITTPLLADSEEEAGEARAPTTGLLVSWDHVTTAVDGVPISITGYEIIITQVEFEDPHGFSTPIFDVHVPPDRNSLSVPAEFLEQDTVYELELLALEESGNQTISVGFFRTE